MKRAAALLALVACNDTPVVRIVPVIDGPTDADATVLPDLDAITLSVAHAGDADDLVSQTFARGEPLVLGGVPFGDDLVIHMSGRIGASEIAYGRTCPFAVAADLEATPHLFFSRSVKFAQLDIRPLPRVGGAAVTYHDGSGIILGGTSPVIERFDPHAGTFLQVADVAARSQAVAAELGEIDPRIALVGGSEQGAGAGYVELIEADNPPLRRVEKIANDRMARVELTATSLTDGRIVAIGGRAPGDPTPSGAIVEIREAAGTIEVRDLRAVLAHPRARHTATRLGDDVGAPVLVVGGVDDAAAPIAIAELFKPLSEELANPATFAPQLVVPRSGHVAALMPDGSVLVIGGIGADGLPVRTLELFSIDAGFTAVGELPMSAGAIEFTATPLPDGRILIAGGRDASGTALASAHIARLDPLDGSVTIVATDDLAVPRAGHQATLLCDGTVFVSGGTQLESVAERYNPPALSRR